MSTRGGDGEGEEIIIRRDDIFDVGGRQMFSKLGVSYCAARTLAAYCSFDVLNL